MWVWGKAPVCAWALVQQSVWVLVPVPELALVLVLVLARALV